MSRSEMLSRKHSWFVAFHLDLFFFFAVELINVHVNSIRGMHMKEMLGEPTIITLSLERETTSLRLEALAYVSFALSPRFLNI